jgi:signal transduction histidine kinase
MPSEARSTKFGLFSIKERMRSLGGALELETSPSKGTTATLVLPLRDAERGEVLGVKSGEENTTCA